MPPWGCRLHFSPRDPCLLVSVGRDHIHLWDTDSGEKLRSFEGCLRAVFSPDGCSIAAVVADDANDEANVVAIVDPESTEELVRVVASTGDIICDASFSLDGSKLALISIDGFCRVWDPSTGALLWNVNVEAASASSVAWGRDWVRDEKCVSFAMGHSPRLGGGSRVLELDVGVVRMILDRV